MWVLEVLKGKRNQSESDRRSIVSSVSWVKSSCHVQLFPQWETLCPSCPNIIAGSVAGFVAGSYLSDVDLFNWTSMLARHFWSWLLHMCFSFLWLVEQHKVFRHFQWSFSSCSYEKTSYNFLILLVRVIFSEVWLSAQKLTAECLLRVKEKNIKNRWTVKYPTREWRERGGGVASARLMGRLWFRVRGQGLWVRLGLRLRWSSCLVTVWMGQGFQLEVKVKWGCCDAVELW